MKPVIVPAKNDRAISESLFHESIEMAKREVSTKLWYNMNIKRIQRLVSFCMDYLLYQREGSVSADEEDDGCLATIPYHN